MYSEENLLYLPNLGSGPPIWKYKIIYKMKLEVNHPFALSLCHVSAASGMTFLG